MEDSTHLRISLEAVESSPEVGCSTGGGQGVFKDMLKR